MRKKGLKEQGWLNEKKELELEKKMTVGGRKTQKKITVKGNKTEEKEWRRTAEVIQ